MAQKLVLPINKCLVTASYKTAAYQARFRFVHYGADLVSFGGQTTVYACGIGTVLQVGADHVLGNVVVIRYDDALHHPTGRSISVICRQYHFASIGVKAGQPVTKDTVVGQYGNTGKYSAGRHLHIEFDSNVETPLASKTLGGNSNIIRAAGADTTIDPCHLLHRKASPPDCQEIRVDRSLYNGQPYASPQCAGIPVL